MKRGFGVCALILMICLSGCSTKQYTYADMPENAGFEMKYIDGQLIYLDYDLSFKVNLPCKSSFAYEYEYENPDLIEGAPIGRSTLTIYCNEENETVGRNIIQVKSTLVGTREGDLFSATGTITIPETERTYLIEEYENGIRILSENTGEPFCVYADLSKTAYESLRTELEEIICSIKYLQEDDPYVQEFIREIYDLRSREKNKENSSNIIMSTAVIGVSQLEQLY